MSDDVRRSGVVETLHPHEEVGAYGLIRGVDGKLYSWNAGHVFRNFSILDRVGALVTFEVVSYSYATNIDRTDKPRTR